MTILSARQATENAFSLGAEHSEQGLKLDINNPALQVIIATSDMPASELVNIYKEGFDQGLIELY